MSPVITKAERVKGGLGKENGGEGRGGEEGKEGGVEGAGVQDPVNVGKP